MSSTEYYTAYWEVPLEREIPAPGGRMIKFKMSRNRWASFDWLVERAGYQPEYLVDLTEREAEHQCQPFDLMFPDIMVWMEQTLKKAYGPGGPPD